jgi:hypothetical protein
MNLINSCCQSLQKIKDKINFPQTDKITIILNGKNYQTSKYKTVQQLKSNIAHSHNFNPDHIKLRFQNVIYLYETEILNDINVTDNTIATCVISDVSTQDIYGQINITIKTMHGLTINLKCNEYETISVLKKRIFLHAGVLEDNLRLILGGTTLKNNKTVMESNICEGCIIHTVTRVKLSTYHPMFSTPLKNITYMQNGVVSNCLVNINLPINKFLDEIEAPFSIVSVIDSGSTVKRQLYNAYSFVVNNATDFLVLFIE